MDKKTKNIITISVIVLLIIGLILTIHFARVNGSRNFVNDRNTQMFGANQGKDSLTKDDISKESDNSKEENSTESSDASQNDRDNSRRNRPGNMPSFNKDDIKDFNDISMPNRGGTMATKYVVLLCGETFLLGGSIVYFVMNNISDNKEKKSKK